MKFGDIKLTNFVELTEDKIKKVLLWRNNAEIRKWMYTTDVISYAEHLNFIDHLNNDHGKKYFLVAKEDEDIGVISFTDIGKDAVCFGLYASPETCVPGVGRILESVSIDYAFKEIKAEKLMLEVFIDNKRVINLHKKFGFKKTREIIVNGKEVVCMELVNENQKS